MLPDPCARSHAVNASGPERHKWRRYPSGPPLPFHTKLAHRSHTFALLHPARCSEWPLRRLWPRYGFEMLSTGMSDGTQRQLSADRHGSVAPHPAVGWRRTPESAGRGLGKVRTEFGLNAAEGRPEIRTEGLEVGQNVTQIPGHM